MERIDVGREIARNANEIRPQVTRLRSTGREINNFRIENGRHWRSGQMIAVDQMLENFQESINKEANNLECLGNDIVSVANAIQREMLNRAESARQAAESAVRGEEQRLIVAQSNYSTNPNSITRADLARVEGDLRSARVTLGEAEAKVRYLS